MEMFFSNHQNSMTALIRILSQAQSNCINVSNNFMKQPNKLATCYSGFTERTGVESVDSSVHDSNHDTVVPGSNASTLSQVSNYTEKDSASSSVCSEEHSVSEYEIVRRVLYSSRENVNIIHEIFRQVRSTNVNFFLTQSSV